MLCYKLFDKYKHKINFIYISIKYVSLFKFLNKVFWFLFRKTKISKQS